MPKQEKDKRGLELIMKGTSFRQYRKDSAHGLSFQDIKVGGSEQRISSTSALTSAHSAGLGFVPEAFID